MRRPAAVLRAAVALAVGIGGTTALVGCSSGSSGSEVSVELRSDLPARTYRVDVFDGTGRRIGGGDFPPGSAFSVHARTSPVKVDVVGVCVLSAGGARVKATISPGNCAI